MAVVLDALASYIQKMMTDMVKEEVHMLLGVPDEFNKMVIRLSDLKNFLLDADSRNITDQTVQGWVREMRNAMYDATDILDLCNLTVMGHGGDMEVGFRKSMLSFIRNPVRTQNIGSRIKKLNKRLDSIKERSAAFGFINLGTYHHRMMSSSQQAMRETTGELELFLVGGTIEEDTRNLVNMLTESDGNRKVKVFAIIGVGGIGKSTLARKILNHENIQQEFQKKIWLSVNKEFNGNELLRRVITEAGGDHRADGNTKVALERALKETLNEHKTLLVMDDVWDHKAWEDFLETPFVRAVAKGSCVLITTRNDMVARGMKSEEPYHHVHKLGLEDSWFLLKNEVLGNRNDQEVEIDTLKDIGSEIIKKCDGLPLAVKVMAGLLRNKEITRGDWETILDRIRSVSQMPEVLNYAMYLSYEDMCPSLKQCFLYYSLIPKGIRFEVEDIIAMWISEGFVHGDSHKLEDIGRDYYNQLIFRNLIEPDTSVVDQSVCNMHDVVRTFGQYVARDDVLVAHNGEADITSKLNSSKFIGLSLYNKEQESNGLQWKLLEAQKSLRTIISIGDIKINPGDSLFPFSSLRTLCLGSANCDPLVESLYQLKHLRYLLLEGCTMSKLTKDIGKLKFLQYIRICMNEGTVKLPDSFVQLRQLRSLNLIGTRIDRIPRGFCALGNLRKLEGFLVHMDNDWCSLEELGPLDQLRYLGLVGLQNVSASSFPRNARLGEKLHLRYLALRCTSKILGNDGLLVEREQADINEEEQGRIEDVFHELCPPPNLESLLIRGYFGRTFPMWMMSSALASLVNLRFIFMEELPCCTELPDGLCRLPRLEHLQIRRAPAIKRVGPEFVQLRHHQSQSPQAFPRLCKLELIEMVEWEEWVWEEQVHAMPKLEYLLLRRCKLRRIPPGLAVHATSLRELYLYHVENLSCLENLGSIVHLQVCQSPDLERICDLQKLQKLEIIKCPKVKVVKELPALHSFTLMDYDMKTLPQYLQNVCPTYLQVHFISSLLQYVLLGEFGGEWYKVAHIEHTSFHGDGEGTQREDVSSECASGDDEEVGSAYADEQSEQSSDVDGLESDTHKISASTYIHTCALIGLLVVSVLFPQLHKIYGHGQH